jgi:hypothetical protein
VQTQSKDDWEVRKVRRNGKRYYVAVPHWWAVPAETVFNAQILFEMRDGKPSIRIVY